MTQEQILEELKHLSTEERLSIVESTLHRIREEISLANPARQTADQKQLLFKAAEDMAPYYVQDTELTSFSALDSEDFRASE